MISARRVTALTILASLLGGAAWAAGPKLREPRKVKPSKAVRLCEVDRTAGVTRDQARCIAGLAGLRTEEGAYTLRDSRSLGENEREIWVYDEICNADNEECIGIVIRKADGKIMETRYLYVVKSRDVWTDEPR
jgi:hypothetical protein